jgi:hypothetical protein
MLRYPAVLPLLIFFLAQSVLVIEPDRASVQMFSTKLVVFIWVLVTPPPAREALPATKRHSLAGFIIEIPFRYF